MKLALNTVTALFLLVLASCGSGGSSDNGTQTPSGSAGQTGGSSGPSPSDTVQPIYLGSCKDTDGMCASTWQVPVEGINMTAMFEQACTSQNGSYSASYVCSGGVPGCCTLPPSVDHQIWKYCYNVTDGDPDGVLKRQCVEGFGGTFE